MSDFKQIEQLKFQSQQGESIEAFVSEQEIIWIEETGTSVGVAHLQTAIALRDWLTRAIGDGEAR